MANAELFKSGLSRIIVPTVYREDYILSLKKFTNRKEPDAFVSGGGSYNYVSGGKHSVTAIKLLSTNKNSGVLTYAVEGTFSCSFKHNQSGKTLEISGKY